ncbi:hypothetical protein KL918_001076 [Ogataea parapolymorpha]|uniref:DNA 3'-5' helicase n=1 Tax=Ogataea parapolymorpha (strain ATCC 26012 / BCRC 20466 / JCM 22074 / NRRL Y-7560 / DL-1) TaxID=871575 RepID=W1QAU5_OGAPD|nr:hypothetical protein HPODL_01562 [Ogataea parapolymorpha DL-1]ESW97463.1 hypothetical protein HPODL_01562 [Ogataea parapolymorpha DL-1]KAG7869531.1 hypothetical protein KL918_001076 [Ogataea parapolymorpha]KAG7875416.1 hypothetical protein KL916_000087 [Ogataea parapolymorpha]
MKDIRDLLIAKSAEKLVRETSQQLSQPSSPTHEDLFECTKAKPISNLSTFGVGDKYASIFKFSQFNKMQTSAFPMIFQDSDNCVVTSPTGSGKTVLFELAIIRALKENSKAKILYLAPLKALCNERISDWSHKFARFNISVGLLTGDSDTREVQRARTCNIVISTPEKWDSFTRQNKDRKESLLPLSLLLLDEIHTIKEKRGANLEAVVTRMKYLYPNIRIIALSATVPNIDDISKWLRKPEKLAATTLRFNESYRSVKLTKTVLGFNRKSTTNEFQFEAFLTSKLLAIIQNYGNKKPVLVFCATRKSTIMTAKALSTKLGSYFPQKPPITDRLQPQLLDLINNGVAYHHGGLSSEERRVIENGFLSGKISVICCTSTLAAGVNLPAYLVVIKGTKTWINGSLQEYSDLEVLQMIGRAGRPQFESQGACVIMTQSAEKAKYEKLIHGTEEVESSLPHKLSEILLKEVASGQISDSQSANDWVKTTFFYQRYLVSPYSYAAVVKPVIYKKPSHCLEFLLQKRMKELWDGGLITIQQGKFVCSCYGDTMLRNCLSLDTMKYLLKSKNIEQDKCLDFLCQTPEFGNVEYRSLEKTLFRKINQSQLIRYRLEGEIEAVWQKVHLVVQFELGRLDYPTHPSFKNLLFNFNYDKAKVLRQMSNVINAGISIFERKADTTSLRSMLYLGRCLSAKAWENTALELTQIEGIGKAGARKLEAGNIHSIKEAVQLSKESFHQFGIKNSATIYDQLRLFPQIHLKARIIKNASASDLLNIAIVITTPIEYIPNYDSSECTILINARNTKELIKFMKIPLRQTSGHMEINLEMDARLNKEIVIYADFTDKVGSGTEVSLSSLQSIDESDFSDEEDVELMLIEREKRKYEEQAQTDAKRRREYSLEMTEEGVFTEIERENSSMSSITLE